MRHVIFTALLLALFVLPLWANAADGDLEAGFRLGRYNSTAMHLGMELTYIESLINEVHPGDITDEALAAGEIKDSDVEMANHALVYVIWRTQFYLDTMLEAAQEEDSFTDPALAEFKAPTLELVEGLQELRDEFMDAADLPALAEFGAALADEGYAATLLELASQAEAKAGVTE